MNKSRAPKLLAKLRNFALPAALKKSKPMISKVNSRKLPVPPPKNPS